MNEIPVVRHFVACAEVVISPDGQSVTLRDLVNNIVRKLGEPFPCVRPGMALYALRTNGRGHHQFTIELTRFDQGAEVLVARVGPVQVDLGQDPLRVLGMPIPLVNVVFSEAGQYAFHLLCDGQHVAEEKVTVR